MYITQIKLNVLNYDCVVDIYGDSVGCGSNPDGEEFFADEVKLIHVYGTLDQKVYDEIDTELSINFRDYEEEIREKIN